MKKLTGFLMLVAVVGLIAAPASASYIINTNFEADSAGAGTWPAGTPWNDPDIATGVAWGRNSYTSISTSNPYAGSQCGRIFRDGDTPAAGRYSILNFGSGENAGIVELTYYAKHATASSTAPDSGGLTKIRDDESHVVTEIDMKYDYDAGGSTRKVRYMNSAGNMVNLMDFAAGTWYEFEVTMNYNTKKYDLTVTNTTNALDTETETGLAFYSSLSDSFDTIVCVETGQLTSAAAYWDDISAVPEPATMILLGLGGVGLLIRRRRRA